MYTMRDPELSGTYRFRWHHTPKTAGDYNPAYKLIASEEEKEQRQKVQAAKKKKKKRKPKVAKRIDEVVEPSSEYLAILALREESRKARVQGRREGEEALPPIVDARTALLHRKFLEEQEKKDFELKEKELEEDNEEKLRQYKKSLWKKQARAEKEIQQRISEFKTKRQDNNYSKKSACRENDDHPTPLTKKMQMNLAQEPMSTSNPSCRKAIGRSISHDKNRQSHTLASDLDLMESIFKKEDAITTTE